MTINKIAAQVNNFLLKMFALITNTTSQVPMYVWTNLAVSVCIFVCALILEVF